LEGTLTFREQLSVIERTSRIARKKGTDSEKRSKETRIKNIGMKDKI
jgi:hypothetical protein